MSPPATWRPLPLPGPHPPLLTSTRFASSSYTIHITDLAHLWTESLDRRPIILRALKEDASIDPSDGEDNMASFLKCLRSAFHPSEPMHNLTTLSLSPADDDGLVLTVTCELPKELSSTPLTWHMHLAKQPAEATARELVVPLIESRRAQSEKVGGLVEIVRQKDALVSKMLDKLEATGTPLEHVFALGARKKVSREQAEARVKGLAPLDRAAWEAAAGDGGSEDVEALVRGVFGEGLGYTPSAEAGRFADGLGGWWRDVGSSSGPRDDRESTVGKRTAPPSSGASQVKSSPVKQRPPPGDVTASDTGSEDDSAPRQPARLLGAIGGAKPRPKAPPLSDDEETASESDEKGGEPPKKELPHREAPSPAGSATASEDEAPARPSPAKRGGLGRIGGARPRREVSGDAESEGATASEDVAPARPPPAKWGGVGRIGGMARPRQEVSEDGEDEGVEDERGETEKKKPERKVLARPVKKKRKF